MKNYFSPVSLFLAFTALSVLPAHALASPSSGRVVPVSVTKFTNKAASGAAVSGAGLCHGFSIFGESLGDAFADVLVEKLGTHANLEVLERDTIHRILDSEVELANSGKDHSIQKGNFRKAKITFVGVVDGFEFCQGASGAGLNVGQLFGIGNITPTVRSSEASVSILIRAIDTTTGRVLATSRSKKSQNKRTLGLDVDAGLVDFSGADFKQSALGETIELAVAEASDSLLKKLKL